MNGIIYTCIKCGGPLAPGTNNCTVCGFSPPVNSSMENDAAMRLVLPVGCSWYAIVAGYLGLVSPMMCTAPFAILFGVLALRDLKKNPRPGGRGRAIFGLVMGLIFTLLPLILILIAAASE